MALVEKIAVVSEQVTKSSITIADLTGAFSASNIVNGVETGNPTGYGTTDTRYSSTNRNQLALLLFAYQKTSNSVDNPVTVNAYTYNSASTFVIENDGDFLYKFIIIAIPITTAFSGNYDLINKKIYGYNTTTGKVQQMLTSVDSGGGVYVYTFIDLVTLTDVLKGDYATTIYYYPRNIGLYEQQAFIFQKYISAPDKDVVETKKLFDLFKLQVLGIEIAYAKSDWLGVAACFDYAKALLNCNAYKCYCGK